MQVLKNHLKAIIFDMDGTIIDSSHKWENAIIECAKFYANNNSLKDSVFFEKLTGSSLYESAAKMKSEFKINNSVKEIVEKIKVFAHQSFDSGVKFISGFEDFQKVLASNDVKRSIATNADLQSFEKLIVSCGFKDMFGEHLYSIDHIGGIAKPNPAIFLHAAEKLGVDPKDCVVFEDSIYGFEAAKAAGMRCIAIKNATNQQFFKLVHGAIDGYHEAVKVMHEVFGLSF